MSNNEKEDEIKVVLFEPGWIFEGEQIMYQQSEHLYVDIYVITDKNNRRKELIDPLFNWIKDKLREASNIDDIKYFCETLIRCTKEENSK